MAKINLFCENLLIFISEVNHKSLNTITVVAFYSIASFTCLKAFSSFNISDDINL